MATLQPLDGGWGWFIVLGTGLGHFLLVGMARSLGVFFIAWTEKFQGSAAATAWVQSLFNTVRMVIGPGVSVLCGRFGCRVIVITGGVLLCAGCVVSAFATSLMYLYFSFSVFAGVGGGLIFTPMFVILNQYFDKKKGRAMAVATMGSGLGTLVLAPLTTFLIAEGGYYSAMLIVAGILLNNVLVGALFRPLQSPLNRCGKGEHNKETGEEVVCVPPPDLSKRSNSTDRCSTAVIADDAQATEGMLLAKSEAAKHEEMEMNAVGHEMEKNPAEFEIEVVDGELEKETESKETPVEDKKKSHSTTRALAAQFALLKMPTFWCYCVYVCALPCGVNAYLIFVPSLILESGLSKTDAAIVLAVAGAVDIVGRFLSGFIFDAKHLRNHRWPVHCIYGIILGLVVALHAVQTTFSGFIVMAVLWGLAEGGYHGQRVTIVSEFLPRDQVAHSVGFMIFWQGIGNLAFPTLAGYIYDQTGSYRPSFWFIGFMLLACAVAFLVNFVIVYLLSRRSKPSVTKPAVA